MSTTMTDDVTAPDLVIFSNPGTFDIQSLTLMGASAKPGAGQSPIGRFGTGLHFAIAGVLRLGGQVRLCRAGCSDITFMTFPQVIRGKSFDVVHWATVGSPETPFAYNPPESLGITNALGQHWEPWMIFREFFTNALDEGGQVNCDWDGANDEHEVQFIIRCPALREVFDHLEDHFLQGAGLRHVLLDEDNNPVVELHRPSKITIAYQRVKMTQSALCAVFTYNLVQHQDLTEDRTLRSEFSAKIAIALAIARCNDMAICKAAICGEWEKVYLPWDHVEKASPEFIAAAMEIRLLPADVRALILRASPDSLDKYDNQVPTNHEAALALAPPEANEVPWSSYVYDLQAELEKALAEARYWKKIALAMLPPALPAPAAPETAIAPPDEIPF